MIVLVVLEDLGQCTLASIYLTIQIISASKVVTEIENIQKGSGAGTLRRNPQSSNFPLRFTFKQVLMSGDSHGAVFSRLG